MNDDGVVFMDLPPDQRGPRTSWKPALLARPGDWAIIPVSAASAGTYSRRFPDFEFHTRTVDGKRVMFARYIGTNGEHA